MWSEVICPRPGCEQIVPSSRRGRPRRWCSTRCRQLGRVRDFVAHRLSNSRYRARRRGSVVPVRAQELSLCRCGSIFKAWRNGKHPLATCGLCKARITSRSFRARPLPQRACSWCHVAFKPTTPHQIYCRDEHNNIAKSVRRKALKRGAARGSVPSLWTIYTRDRGRCGLCRGRVGRSFKWPHPRTASLDHIVPISHGGKDEAANLQIAHLACNMAKQTRACGSQLLLIG